MCFLSFYPLRLFFSKYFQQTTAILVLEISMLYDCYVPCVVLSALIFSPTRSYTSWSAILCCANSALLLYTIYKLQLATCTLLLPSSSGWLGTQLVRLTWFLLVYFILTKRKIVPAIHPIWRHLRLGTNLSNQNYFPALGWFVRR